MLEIIVLIAIARRIGGIVERKGRMKIGYQLMAVALWIGGEILGFIVGGIMANAMHGGGAFILLYGCGLGGAILGAVIAFSLVNSLPSVERDDELYRGADVHGMRSFDEYNRRHGRPDGSPPGRALPDGDRKGIQRDDAPRREADERYQD